MKTIVINGVNYAIEKNYDGDIDCEEVLSLCTDYFYDYDYILGDYSYSKLRLKGFYDSKNKKVRKINDIKGKEEYLNKYCSFRCKYFLLSKQKDK